MAQIIPIRDLRKMTEISEMRNRLVIMSMKDYKERLARADIIAKVREAEVEIETGAKLIDGREALESLRKKYVK